MKFKHALLAPARLPMIGLAAFGASVDDLMLWHAQPATKWLEALPVGNGSLGGMTFGGTTNEQVQVNGQTLWLGDQIGMGIPWAGRITDTLDGTAMEVD